MGLWLFKAVPLQQKETLPPPRVLSPPPAPQPLPQAQPQPRPAPRQIQQQPSVQPWQVAWEEMLEGVFNTVVEQTGFDATCQCASYDNRVTKVIQNYKAKFYCRKCPNTWTSIETHALIYVSRQRQEFWVELAQQRCLRCKDAWAIPHLYDVEESRLTDFILKLCNPLTVRPARKQPQSNPASAHKKEDCEFCLRGIHHNL
ncbi:hypothetical protein Pelo_7171 [Pelomyxa schiedti]|nr:hypothetical protein Pelo_7171 [Pelomyxa schiedti]